jgi:succinyl-CoA synthetase alpha subunit
MSILITPQTKILVQGITGAFGAKHAQLSLDYGTQLVAGVTPGKGGQFFDDSIPIFDTVSEARALLTALAPEHPALNPPAQHMDRADVDYGIEL